MAKKFIISSLPGRGGTNPYVDLFYTALEPHGISLYQAPEIGAEWARDNFSNIDALHFHWPELIWRSPLPMHTKKGRRSFLRTHIPGVWRFSALNDRIVDRIKRTPVVTKFRAQIGRWLSLRQFVSFLRRAEQSKVRIIWTLHNLESHENWGALDRIGFQLLARHANLILCHSSHTKKACLKTYKPKCPIIVMPHGNYDGIYPPPRQRDEVLTELGLDPELPVAGCIGALREYKGFDLACEAISLLKGEVQLLCAGTPHKYFHLQEFERLIHSTPHAVLVARQLTDQEFSDYCSACDVILLPYRKITGSGALLAALTLGRGVVASELPYFREALDDSPDAGILTETENTRALADAIKKYLHKDKIQRETAAHLLAKRYDWQNVIKPVAEELKAILG